MFPINCIQKTKSRIYSRPLFRLTTDKAIYERENSSISTISKGKQVISQHVVKDTVVL